MTNLYECPRCGWTTDVGDDDAAGDENAVRDRIAHTCGGSDFDMAALQEARGAFERAYIARAGAGIVAQEADNAQAAAKRKLIEAQAAENEAWQRYEWAIMGAALAGWQP